MSTPYYGAGEWWHKYPEHLWPELKARTELNDTRNMHIRYRHGIAMEAGCTYTPGRNQAGAEAAGRWCSAPRDEEWPPERLAAERWKDRAVLAAEVRAVFNEALNRKGGAK